MVQEPPPPKVTVVLPPPVSKVFNIVSVFPFNVIREAPPPASRGLPSTAENERDSDVGPRGPTTFRVTVPLTLPSPEMLMLKSFLTGLSNSRPLARALGFPGYAG